MEKEEALEMETFQQTWTRLRTLELPSPLKLQRPSCWQRPSLLSEVASPSYPKKLSTTPFGTIFLQGDGNSLSGLPSLTLWLPRQVKN